MTDLEAGYEAVRIPLRLADTESLREHLEALNERGVTPVVVGIDTWSRAFLITLVGPYAESEDVFFDSPWQTDCEYGELVDGVLVPKQPRCEDCRAVSHDIEDLRFPVTVLAQAPEWGEECATCGVKPRREDALHCSEGCAAADPLSQPDPNEQYDRDGLFRG